MDPERRREIARRGGASVPSEKRSFAQDRDLAANAGRKGQAEWLSTHPADTTRINNIRGWVNEAMKYYRPRD